MCFCIPLHWFSTVFPCICALDGQVWRLRHQAYDTTLNKLLTRPFSFHSALHPTFLNTQKNSSVRTAHKGKILACAFTSCASDITKISTTALILICCAVYKTETYFFRQRLKDSIYFRQYLKMAYKHKRLKTKVLNSHWPSESLYESGLLVQPLSPPSVSSSCWSLAHVTHPLHPRSASTNHRSEHS